MVRGNFCFCSVVRTGALLELSALDRTKPPDVSRLLFLLLPPKLPLLLLVVVAMLLLLLPLPPTAAAAMKLPLLVVMTMPVGGSSSLWNMRSSRTSSGSTYSSNIVTWTNYSVLFQSF